MKITYLVSLLIFLVACSSYSPEVANEIKNCDNEANCLVTVAANYNDPSICNQVENKDTCLWAVAFLNVDLERCDEIKDFDIGRSCVTTVNNINSSVETCEKKVDLKDKEVCYTNFQIEKIFFKKYGNNEEYQEKSEEEFCNATPGFQCIEKNINSPDNSIEITIKNVFGISLLIKDVMINSAQCEQIDDDSLKNIEFEIGDTNILKISCANDLIGQYFEGNIEINYLNTETNLDHTASITIAGKIE